MDKNKARYNRQKDALWLPDEDVPVLIGGAGGIGSWLTLLLQRAGFIPYVYDFDVVEEHNMGGQLFGTNHISMPKVEALNQIVKELTGDEIQYFNEKYTEETMTNNYCFAGFDNMEARKVMFNNWVLKNHSNPDSIFIDGRLIMEQMTIICIKGNDKDAIENYRTNLLFDDSEVEDAPCTARQTSHSAAMIAAQMVAFFTNFIVNINSGGTPRQVPPYWEYFIPLDYVSYKAEE